MKIRTGHRLIIGIIIMIPTLLLDLLTIPFVMLFGDFDNYRLLSNKLADWVINWKGRV